MKRRIGATLKYMVLGSALLFACCFIFELLETARAEEPAAYESERRFGPIRPGPPHRPPIKKPPISIPEPSTWLLISVGGAGLWWLSQKSKKRNINGNIEG